MILIRNDSGIIQLDFSEYEKGIYDISLCEYPGPTPKKYTEFANQGRDIHKSQVVLIIQYYS